jgi:hypothetical protein
MPGFFRQGKTVRRGEVVRSLVLLAIAVLALSFVPRAFAASAASTQTELTATTDNSSSRTTVTLSAHVAALSGFGAPAGVVTFRAGSSELGSAVLDPDGNATLTTNNLAPGSHQNVVAIYRGDASHAGSISPSAEVSSSNSGVAGFTLSASPTSISMPVGSSANSIVTITPVNGFNAYVSLSCSGLPVASTCTFSPINVLAACTTSGSTTTCPQSYSTMQIQTLAPSGELTMPPGTNSRLPVYALLFPAVFGVAGLGARKKRAAWNALLLLFLFAGAMSITACNVRYNYLHHGPTPNPGTPTGTYTVTINSISTTGSLSTTPPTSPQIALTLTGN